MKSEDNKHLFFGGMITAVAARMGDVFLDTTCRNTVDSLLLNTSPAPDAPHKIIGTDTAGSIQLCQNQAQFYHNGLIALFYVAAVIAVVGAAKNIIETHREYKNFSTQVTPRVKPSWSEIQHFNNQCPALISFMTVGGIATVLGFLFDDSLTNSNFYLSNNSMLDIVQQQYSIPTHDLQDIARSNMHLNGSLLTIAVVLTIAVLISKATIPAISVPNHTHD